MMDVRNPKWVSKEGVECEIEHPTLGWIPTLVNMVDDDRPWLVDALNSIVDQIEPMGDRSLLELPVSEQINTVVNGLTYEFPDGRIVYVRPQDKCMMEDAVYTLENTDLDTVMWTTVNGESITLNLDEVKNMYHAGMIARVLFNNDYLKRCDHV